MPQIITHGEMLIDFVSTINGVSLIEAPAFIKAPGGAPANVAVGLARLGVTAALWDKWAKMPSVTSWRKHCVTIR